MNNQPPGDDRALIVIPARYGFLVDHIGRRFLHRNFNGEHQVEGRVVADAREAVEETLEIGFFDAGALPDPFVPIHQMRVADFVRADEPGGADHVEAAIAFVGDVLAGLFD